MLTALMHVLAVHSASGQSRGTLVPSIDIATLHDDNVFVTSRTPASDQVVRISPALSAERPFVRGGYSGFYSLDAERYARHHELTNPAARVQAFSRVHYNAGQRLRLMLDHGYLDTTAPTELNLGTALAAARIRTTRMSGGSTAAYRLSRRASATASYQITRDRLEDGRTMRTSIARAGVDRALSRRVRLAFDYESSRFDSLSQTTAAHAVRLGWTHAIGTSTQLQLRGGPRVTEGAASADLFALVNHTLENGALSVSFEQAQTTVIGMEVPIEARSVQVRGTWTPFRSLSCAAAPAIFRSTFGGRDIDVFRIGLEARYAMNKAMAFEASFGAETQRGTAGAASTGVETLRHRTLSFGVRQQWK
jgi:hypothetical protein